MGEGSKGDHLFRRQAGRGLRVTRGCDNVLGAALCHTGTPRWDRVTQELPVGQNQPSVAGNSARQAHGAEPGPIHLPLTSEPSDHKSGRLGRGEQQAQITQMDLPNKYI